MYVTACLLSLTVTILMHSQINLYSFRVTSIVSTTFVTSHLTIFCVWPRPGPAERWRVVALTILHLRMWPVVMWWRERLLFWRWVIPPVPPLLREHVTGHLREGAQRREGVIKSRHLPLLQSVCLSPNADLVVQRRIRRNVAEGIYMRWCLLHTAHLHPCKCTEPKSYLGQILGPMLCCEDIAYTQLQLRYSIKNKNIFIITAFCVQINTKPRIYEALISVNAANLIQIVNMFHALARSCYLHTCVGGGGLAKCVRAADNKY